MRKKIPQALSELPANWPGLTSLFGLVMYFCLSFLFYFDWNMKPIASSNGLFPEYSERGTSSVH